MKKAFTLIELLVVMAIVAVLAALVAGVSSRMKVASARAISAHTLSGLIASAHLYLKDNDNAFWPYQQAVNGGVQWWFGYESAASTRMPEGRRICDYSQGPLGPYASASGGMKTDPAFLEFSPRLKPKYENGNYGYGYNTALAADSTGTPRNAASIADPSQMIVFATCAQVNTFQAPATAKKPMVEEFYLLSPGQRTMHFRHGGDALAAFLDGSVRPLRMDTEMQPGTQDMRLPAAKIGCIKTAYLKQDGW